MRNKYCTGPKLDTNVYYAITWRDVFYDDLMCFFCTSHSATSLDYNPKSIEINIMVKEKL